MLNPSEDKPQSLRLLPVMIPSLPFPPRVSLCHPCCPLSLSGASVSWGLCALAE